MRQKYILILPNAQGSGSNSALSGKSSAYLLDLDPVMGYLSAFYPPVGRPAKNQVQIIRSLILMALQGFTSLTAWVVELTTDSLLAALIGCTPDSLPPLGSYFDLMDRLWTQSDASQQTGQKRSFPKR